MKRPIKISPRVAEAMSFVDQERTAKIVRALAGDKPKPEKKP